MPVPSSGSANAGTFASSTQHFLSQSPSISEGGPTLMPIPRSGTPYYQPLKYANGELGNEMGPYARFWGVYLKEADIADQEMAKRWKDGIDVLLPFAGLFSAVVTAFVVEAGKKLQVDQAAVQNLMLKRSLELQEALANGVRPGNGTIIPDNALTQPSFTRSDVWVYGLWIASLVCSISTALMATVVRQWIQYYISTLSGTPCERARIRQLRFTNLRRWSVRTIVGIIPLALHVAVFLFFSGLPLFLQNLNSAIAQSVTAIGSVILAFYVITTLLPLFYPHCPYRTPFAGWLFRNILALRRLWCHFSQELYSATSTPELIRSWLERHWTPCPNNSDLYWPQSRETLDLEAKKDAIDVDALMWLSESTSIAVQAAAAEAVGSLGEEFAQYEKLVKDGVHDVLLRSLNNHPYTLDPLEKDATAARLFWSSLHAFTFSMQHSEILRVKQLGRGELLEKQELLLHHATSLLALWKPAIRCAKYGKEFRDSEQHPGRTNFTKFALSNLWHDDITLPRETRHAFTRIFFELYDPETEEFEKFFAMVNKTSNRRMRFQNFIDWAETQERKLHEDLRRNVPWLTYLVQSGPSRQSQTPNSSLRRLESISNIRPWMNHRRSASTPNLSSTLSNPVPTVTISAASPTSPTFSFQSQDRELEDMEEGGRLQVPGEL